MFKNYANAQNVLPEDLFNQIKPYFSGGILYVPGDGKALSPKVQLVLSMIRDDASREKIAAALGISPRRVNQIIAKYKSQEGDPPETD